MFLHRSLIQAAALALLTLLAACGTSNDAAPTVDPVRGKHPSTWVFGHRAYYHDNEKQCFECHGSDLKGGITKVDCFNQAGDVRCHTSGGPGETGGHGPRSITHALPFTDPNLHGIQARADLINCQACHGQPGIPGTNPRYNITIGNLQNGCETCHPARAGHPKPWAMHRAAGNTPHACDICHGASLEGGSGPKCASCHTGLAAGGVPVAGQCISCHGAPPNGPPDAAMPNIPGAHVRHNNLAGVTGACDTCHSGGGTGTAQHGNGSVRVSFLPSYNAKSGAAAFNAATQTCENVSCHGGITTPPWRTGVIELSSGCTSCHSAGTAQYNSYFSGEHQFHLIPATSGGSVGLVCDDCHDTVKLATKHFAGLSTQQLEGPPASTIKDYVRYNGTSCMPLPSGARLGVCHFLPEVPRAW